MVYLFNPKWSCGRINPDSSLLRGAILRLTQLYALRPGVFLVTNNAFKLCVKN